MLENCRSLQRLSASALTVDARDWLLGTVIDVQELILGSTYEAFRVDISRAKLLPRLSLVLLGENYT